MEVERLARDFTIDELKIKAKELKRPYKKIEIDGKAICDNIDLDRLDGEDFKKHPTENVYVSNMGRILSFDKKEIYRQEPDPNAPEKNYDYLYVRAPHLLKVWRLVAETWCERISKGHYIVHHISNNGYDNRQENLMWVTSGQHYEIHKDLIEEFK